MTASNAAKPALLVTSQVTTPKLALAVARDQPEGETGLYQYEEGPPCGCGVLQAHSLQTAGSKVVQAQLQACYERRCFWGPAATGWPALQDKVCQPALPL